MSGFGRVICYLGILREKKLERDTSPEYIKNSPERTGKDFLEVYLSNRIVILGGNREFVLSLERHGIYKASVKKFYKQLNKLLKDVTRVKGSVQTPGKNVKHSFDREEVSKILNSLEIRYK